MTTGTRTRYSYTEPATRPGGLPLEYLQRKSWTGGDSPRVVTPSHKVMVQYSFAVPAKRRVLDTEATPKFRRVYKRKWRKTSVSVPYTYNVKASRGGKIVTLKQTGHKLVTKRESYLEPWLKPTKKGQRVWKYTTALVWKTRKRVYRTPKRVQKRTGDNPYSMQNVTIGDVELEYEYTANGLWTDTVTNVMETSGSFRPKSTIVQAWTSNDEIRLYSKLREKILGSDFNMGVFLAEFGQTAALIGDAAFRLDRAFRDARKGHFADAWEHIHTGKGRKTVPTWGKSSASNWLALQYGVLPLLQDVEGGAQALAKAVNEPYVQTYRVKGIKGAKVNILPSETFTMATGYTTKKYIVRVKSVNAPQLLGLTDPLSIGWEKTPWSFVADWFIPIGEYLSALLLWRSVQMSSTCSTVAEYSLLKGFRPKPGFQTRNFRVRRAGPEGDFVMENLSVTRSLANPFSSPPPTPTVKSLGEIASWRRAANAVALFTQRHGTSARAG